MGKSHAKGERGKFQVEEECQGKGNPIPNCSALLKADAGMPNEMVFTEENLPRFLIYLGDIRCGEYDVLYEPSHIPHHKSAFRASLKKVP